MQPTSASALLQAPWYVHVHLALALLSVVVGTAVFLRTKGTASHKLLGRTWVVAMLTLTVLSFAIRTSGSFSAIHLLSVLTLITVPLGVYHARKGNIGAHKLVMCSTFAGLAIAGIFTLLPQRILGQLIFGPR